MAVNILALLAAMVIYAYFSDCNPIQMKRITKTDEYFPFFVVHYLPLENLSSLELLDCMFRQFMLDLC